jgi:fructose-1,6-bisphosphatase/inositol monophosphatase family enzyme
MSKPRLKRRELSPIFVAAAHRRQAPVAETVLGRLLKMTEAVRSDVLLPASKKLDSLDISYKFGDTRRQDDAKNITIQTDRDCESLMAALAARHFPEALFLGEEMFGDKTPDEKRAALTAATTEGKPVILADSLDATRDFRGGGDGYAVMLAVVQDDELKAAVVHRCTDYADPKGNGHTLTYEEGDAVRIDGRLVRPLSERVFPARATQLRGYAMVEYIEAARGVENGYPNLGGRFDSLSDLWTCSKMFTDILEGRHHFMLVTPPVDLFDYPAGIALITKAGGVVKFLDGTPATFGEIVRRQAVMQEKPEGADATAKALGNTLVFAVSEGAYEAVRAEIMGPSAPGIKPAALKPAA